MPRIISVGNSYVMTRSQIAREQDITKEDYEFRVKPRSYGKKLHGYIHLGDGQTVIVPPELVGKTITLKVKIK